MILRTLQLADPELTPLGKAQAADANKLWKEEIRAGMPLPHKLYCSPFTRAIQTHQITFEDVLPKELKTLIVEVCFEMTFFHECVMLNQNYRIAESTTSAILVMSGGLGHISKLHFPNTS